MNQTQPDEPLAPTPLKTANTPQSLPGENHHCLHCGYSLHKLQTWRCPECNYVNAAKELAENEEYLAATMPFVAKCILIPLVIPFISLTCLANSSLDPGVIPLLVILGIATIICLLVMPLTFICAAARLTQVRIMKRRQPEAISVRPARALFEFSLHFAWMAAIPTLILGTIITLTN